MKQIRSSSRLGLVRQGVPATRPSILTTLIIPPRLEIERSWPVSDDLGDVGWHEKSYRYPRYGNPGLITTPKTC